jgi:RNA polymerase-associated protein
MYRIQRDWCDLADQIIEASLADDEETAESVRKELRDSLVTTSPIFDDKPFFMSEDFTLVDCCLAPLLWRLPLLGIDIPEEQCKPLVKYMERLFERESFQVSLSEAEREMRD